MDRLRALEIFKAVALKGSFVKAAASMDMSTAVVTRAVQELEKLLGARLLQRSTRRLSLTPEGEGVLDRASGLLSSFDELLAESRSRTSEAVGEIRFTAPASFGAARLGPVIADFMAAHPKVRIELLLTDTPLDLIDERIDLALRVARTLPPSLIARRIGDAAVGLYGAPAYLRSRGTPKHPAELNAHECLVYSGGGRDATWEFSHPVTQQRIQVRPHGLLCANNAEALMAAAVHGSGLAMLPRMLAEPAVARGELASVLSHWQSPALGIWLVYVSRRNQPLRLRKLIEHLSRAFSADADARQAPTATSTTAAYGAVAA